MGSRTKGACLVTRDALEQLVRDARELDPGVSIDPDEEWDSLDQLAILGELRDRLGDIDLQLDLSDANSLNKLWQILSDK